MKKKWMLLAAVLILVLSWMSASSAESSALQDLRIGMGFSPTKVRPGDSVSVTITISNISGKDFPDPMTLHDPKGVRIEEFGNPVLKFLGKISLEVIMLNLLMIGEFMFLYVKYGIWAYLPAVIVSTIVCASVVYLIKNIVLERRSGLFDGKIR